MIGWLALAALAGLACGLLLAKLLRDQPTLAVPSQRPTSSSVGDSRIAEAVRSLPMGLVLANDSGVVIYRNAYAASFEEGPRVTKALVRGHVSDLLASAMEGESEIVEIDVFGPPRIRLRFSGRPVIEDGLQVGAVVFISDITEEHRIDLVRRDFVANVSHELKTPVGAMSILAETLATAEDPDTVARLSDRISTAALRLGDTVDDLLTLSRIESSESPELERLELSGLVSAAIDSCRDQAESRSVTLTGPIALAETAVLGDRVQLHSALSNLITNAIKYSDEADNVNIELETDGDWIDIHVVDRGIGIPESSLQRIFERFYRVDTARSRSTGGTGLGLSIVRHVAINHGGRVTVKSEEGKGSVFTMRLPIHGGGSTTAASTDTSTEFGGGS